MDRPTNPPPSAPASGPAEHASERARSTPAARPLRPRFTAQSARAAARKSAATRRAQASAARLSDEQLAAMGLKDLLATRAQVWKLLRGKAPLGQRERADLIRAALMISQEELTRGRGKPRLESEGSDKVEDLRALMRHLLMNPGAAMAEGPAAESGADLAGPPDDASPSPIADGPRERPPATDAPEE